MYAYVARRLLLIPALAYLLVVYALPVAHLLALSVWSAGPTVRPFAEIAGRPDFLRILATTLEIAMVMTVIAVILGYPVAYYLTQLSGRQLAVAMIFVLFPLLTSVLVRTFAWIALLGRVGVFNEMLMHIGVIAAPLPLLFNRTGVYIGLVHVQMPLAILAIYGVMRGIDRGLLRAAEALGASPIRVFWRVFLPLSLPGVSAGALLVFVGGVGAYATPLLLGGLRDMMLANAIGDQIENTLNWPLGAALSVVLLAMTVALLTVYFRLIGADRVWANRA